LQKLSRILHHNQTTTTNPCAVTTTEFVFGDNWRAKHKNPNHKPIIKAIGEGFGLLLWLDEL
jgi:hypothetical protein